MAHCKERKGRKDGGAGGGEAACLSLRGVGDDRTCEGEAGKRLTTKVEKVRSGREISHNKRGRRRRGIASL
eukprot:766400-Hanusia_phi.AAC.11